ncbi:MULTISPECIES: hypothetical protein [Myxococcus]|uniref:hypothetical protein n=1 Tax=Myxococcus TaxID=32 RepID=UPI0013D62D0D|nr:MULTISPECIES: hypothetical protein [Myxococcus]NVJ22003.1 hypothetical protein [Myxococcus sp. AM011]
MPDTASPPATYELPMDTRRVLLRAESMDSDIQLRLMTHSTQPLLRSGDQVVVPFQDAHSEGVHVEVTQPERATLSGHALHVESGLERPFTVRGINGELGKDFAHPERLATWRLVLRSSPEGTGSPPVDISPEVVIKKGGGV